MTVEELEQLHAAALAQGADPEKLAKLRAEVIRQTGSLQRAADMWEYQEKLDAFRAAIARPQAPTRDDELEQLAELARRYPAEAAELLPKAATDDPVESTPDI